MVEKSCQLILSVRKNYGFGFGLLRANPIQSSSLSSHRFWIHFRSFALIGSALAALITIKICDLDLLIAVIRRVGG